MLPEMQKAMDLAWEWSCKDHGYESKNARIREWNQNNQAIDTGFIYYDIFCHIFAGTLLHPQGMTYQAMIGYIAGNVKCADPLDRAKCAAEIIALAYQADLIVITKISDTTMMVTTEFELPVEIPAFGKHRPSYVPPKELDYNPILGTRFKQHDNDVCLEHINKMNAIPLVLEQRIINSMEEYQKAEPETAEQLEQWEDFKRRSLEVYQEARQHPHFYLNHSYDTRGRVYCSGYYINYQGASYKKAIVQLANKEVVELWD
jgi:hypothetical protein